MSKKEENGLLFIWVVSVVATLGSLYFSEIRHYEPCKLCWIQRIFMYPIVMIITVAFIQKNARIAVTTAVFSVIGGCISLYHYGIQKLSFLAENAPSCGAIACTGQYINWLGFITIPFLALTAFLLIAGASFYLIKATK
ncbi:disulfide bond formation protein B [Lysinibacillus macroides]|uniref:Probable disulfide formation protein n=1 Tax=Lysinibacillus macroides TaxID=33935 RepID=A0A0M9DKY7_9BACI|nr:disulfide oxidoreductase [Lysinibacillus macroides]KOY82282.1 disulfide bond formation protein DsbB [Lysinibacillus macroides]QPR68132.1 disulfide bond formation protein B [Lysinibacillus macroides]